MLNKTIKLLILIFCFVSVFAFTINAQKSFTQKEFQLEKTLTYGNGIMVRISGQNLVFRRDSPNYPILLFQTNQGGNGNWGILKSIQVDQVAHGGSYSPLYVGISGSNLVIGPNNPSTGISIFNQNTGGMNNWGLVKKIPVGTGWFWHHKVAIDGNLLVASSFGSQKFINIYEKDSGGTDNWGLLKQISNQNSSYKDSFSISGNTLVAGSPSGFSIYEKNEGGVNNWGVVKQINSNMPCHDIVICHDMHLSISGNTIVTSESYYTPFKHIYRIYERNSGGINNWGLTKTFEFNATESPIYSEAQVSGNYVVLPMPRGIYERNLGGNNNWGLLKSFARPLYFLSIDGDTVAGVVNVGGGAIDIYRNLPVRLSAETGSVTRVTGGSVRDYGVAQPPFTNVYEPFDYASGNAINAKTGGSGWGGAWTGGDSTGLPRATNAGLAYSGLNAVGNASTMSPTRISRLFTNPLQGNNGTSVRISMLVKSNIAGNLPSQAILGNFGGGEKLNIGDITGTESAAGNWGIETASGRYYSNVPVATNQVTYLVVQIDFKAGNDEIRLWVNPPAMNNLATGTLPATHNLKITSDNISSLSGLFWQTSHGQMIDEIRVEKLP